MSPQAQRIAIAEACGWLGNQTNLPKVASSYYEHGTTRCHFPVDYLSDLNTMHEAEKTLSPEQMYRYGCRLQGKPTGGTTGEWMWKLVHATAGQRAEAFLRTIGKWDDTK